MKKILILTFCLLGFLTQVSFAQSSAGVPPSTPPKSEIQNKILETKLKQVKNLKEKGKYELAKKILKKISTTSLSREEKKKVAQESLDLNTLVLFSKLEIPQDQIYTVTSGDRLYTIAQKYKTTVEVVKKTNRLKNDIIYPGMKLKMVSGGFSIRVDKSANSLSLYFKDKLVKKYQVATGKENSTPVGQFEIINKLENPTWFHAGAVVPPDSEENILGTRWLGFDHPGYGIHGTTMPETIGQHASAGCVRMKNEEVEELYAVIPIGTKVTIVE